MISYVGQNANEGEQVEEMDSQIVHEVLAFTLCLAVLAGHSATVSKQSDAAQHDLMPNHAIYGLCCESTNDNVSAEYS